MSSLAWIDFDESERQRAQRIMALFQERESRDELGLGAIRDSIADHLFPGTSTIQTRLRYMLFIPWILRRLEGRDGTASKLSVEGRSMEVRLSDALKKGARPSGSLVGTQGGGCSVSPAQFTGRALAPGASGSSLALAKLISQHCRPSATADNAPR